MTKIYFLLIVVILKFKVQVIKKKIVMTMF